jgi:hypothetical protein
MDSHARVVKIEVEYLCDIHKRIPMGVNQVAAVRVGAVWEVSYLNPKFKTVELPK